MASVPTRVIDVSTEPGKNFVRNVEKLKKELNISKKGDKVKQIRHLSEEEIESNPFLKDFMHSKDPENDVFKNFEVRRIMIGNFGRKSGYTYPPIEEEYFRFFIHLGDPEVYYLDNEQQKDKMLPLTNGYGFIIPSYTSQETSIVVYQDPIRIIRDPNIQQQIPKIRPRNYSRTTIVYDLFFDVGPLLEDLEEEEEKA